MKTLSTGLAALLIGLSTTLAGAASAAGTISVSGTGVVSAPPDMATMSIGVTEQAKDAQDAMRRASESVAGILARLEAMGIDKSNVQTRRITVNPVWSDRRGGSENPPKITGFVAGNSLSVKVTDLTKLGGLLDQVMSEGANDFRGLSFGLQDPEPATNAARRAAVADAMAKAKLYAEAAGVELGDVLSISEQGGRPRPVMMEMAAARDMSSTPIAEGEVSVTAEVSIVFEIED